MVKKGNDKFAAFVTVGAKGQIVIPKEMRDVFNIKPNDRLLVIADTKRGIAIPPHSEATDALFGRIENEIADDSD
ncbi:MAG: AbrB/MazE/SpoVT family DNA-binding domain-containing protein [Clostridia bacterium]|nr:AbrB/MazE/SpoVT family DNA-binding domain-containing protein [Clostridia bacterium]